MANMDMVRRFAGADPDEDPALLEWAYAAAVSWYERAGIPSSTTGALYEFWVANLAAFFYDNRGATDSSVTIPKYIVESVHQLRPKRGTKRRWQV